MNVAHIKKVQSFINAQGESRKFIGLIGSQLMDYREEQDSNQYRMTSQKVSGGGLGTHSDSRKAVFPNSLWHGIPRIEGNMANQIILGEEIWTRKLGWWDYLGVKWQDWVRTEIFFKVLLMACVHLWHEISIFRYWADTAAQHQQRMSGRSLLNCNIKPSVPYIKKLSIGTSGKVLTGVFETFEEIQET